MRSPTLTLTLALLGPLLGAEITAAAGSPEASRGRSIYLEGRSPSGGRITAALSHAGVEIDAVAMHCSSCHGRDGRGRAEGGVTPTDITWPALTKSYGVRHRDGRQHPPYTESDLARAITGGVDPAGNELHVVMPRYRMSDEDLGDLITYLKSIGTDLDPGLSADRIRIGSLLPLEGGLAERGHAIRAVLEAYFETTSLEGGIHGRRLELWVEPLASEPAGSLDRLRQMLEDRSVFALTALFMANAEREMAALLRELEVPLVGPLTLDPQLEPPVNRQVFYLYPGLRGHARALVDFAAGTLTRADPTAAILDPRPTGIGGLVEAITSQAERRGWSPMRSVRLDSATFEPTAVAEELERAGVETLFLLGTTGAELALVEAAAERGWSPTLLLPGALAGSGIFELAAAAGLGVFLSYPTLPTDRSIRGLDIYRRLAAQFELPSSFRSAQLEALCAATVLVEGLKRAGRDLTREGLITALESLLEYDTGFMRPITYGPNRRVGTGGAHVVSVDPAGDSLLRAGAWVEPR